MRALVLGFGVISYLYFFAVLLYVIGFVTSVGVPRDINNGITGEGMQGFLINAMLLGVFAVQHTIMARPRFKDWLSYFLPRALERSLFVLFSTAILHLLVLEWRAYPEVLWVAPESWRGILTGISLAGFGLGLVATFLIDHFDLFGLRQVYHYFKGQSYVPPKFVRPWLYTKVRNPLMTGFLIGFWVTPELTVGHLFFNCVITIYVFFGVYLEERDLAKAHGEVYIQHKKKTPMLFPFFIRFK